MNINREVEHPRPSTKAAKWVEANRNWLEQNHAGKWIAVGPEGLLAVGDSALAVSEDAKLKGYADPLLTAVRRRDFQGIDLIRPWR